jgi:putative transposase
MPRRTRRYIPGLPYHSVQRGNNREACFIEPENYQYYLTLWQQIAKRYGVSVHAYCLMTNHIHFLVTPTSELAISNTMKVVGSRYASYINCRYKRTGTLWEGRHRSSLVQSEKYLLTCSQRTNGEDTRVKILLKQNTYIRVFTLILNIYSPKYLLGSRLF